MTTTTLPDTDRRVAATATARYARCIEVSRRVRWDIERDVVRGRRFDRAHRFLPEGLARIGHLGFLDDGQRLLLNQIQGRTYAHMFGLVERFIAAKILEVGRDHALGDQVALEALVRFADEELKHQALFRRIEALAADVMPAGYRFAHDPDAVAAAVLAAPTWAVLALTCHIELFTQVHYRHSIEPAEGLSPLYKDVFLHHWREESQHAVLDELEWQREDARLDDAARDVAVDALVALIGAVDGIVRQQARDDAAHHAGCIGVAPDAGQAEAVERALLAAYRWQYIVSGAQEPRFVALLSGMVTPRQMQRVQEAVAPLAAGGVQR